MKGKYLATVLLLGILLSAFFYWQNNDIVVTNYIYKSKKISDTFEGYQIAQISDLHNKSFGRKQRVLLKILQKAKPDIIVITGDLVDSHRTDVDAALEFIKGAVKIAPVYYVTGNHEECLTINDWNKLKQGMKQFGVIDMNNKVISVRDDNKSDINIIGLSDTHLSDETLMNLSTYASLDKLTILLAHEPEFIKHYSEAGVDLAFTGHAHGGQIRLPLLGGLYTTDQGFFPRYTSGAFVIADMTMIISRGLGNSVFPFRIFNRPEVVILRLKKEDVSD